MRKHERQSSRLTIPKRPVFNEKLLEEDIASGRATKTVDKHGNEVIHYKGKKPRKLTRAEIQNRILALKDCLRDETLKMFRGPVRHRMMFGPPPVKRFFECRVAEDIIKVASLDRKILEDSFVRDVVYGWILRGETKRIEDLTRILNGKRIAPEYSLPHVLAQAVWFHYEGGLGCSRDEALWRTAEAFNLGSDVVENSVFLPTDRYVSPFSHPKKFKRIADSKVHQMVKDEMATRKPGDTMEQIFRNVATEVKKSYGLKISWSTVRRDFYKGFNVHKDMSKRQAKEKLEAKKKKERRLKPKIERCEKELQNIHERLNLPCQPPEKSRLEHENEKWLTELFELSEELYAP